MSTYLTIFHSKLDSKHEEQAKIRSYSISCHNMVVISDMGDTYMELHESVSVVKLYAHQSPKYSRWETVEC